ncbi:MAG: hypothetical protein ACXWC4_13320 [Telluria sp.]
MTIHTVTSAGKNGHNEDLIAVFEREGWTDLVILDGATSVAGEDYVDPQAGDVVWFVRAFAAALGSVIDPARSQEDSVRVAIEQVRASFDARAAQVAVPMYAWPIAALSWVRLWHEAGTASLQGYFLGDCKTILQLSDGHAVDLDPWVNPYEAVVQQEVARLVAQGDDDPATRLERMLPMLRARREFQNSTDAPNSLCLRPGGPFDARQLSMELERGSMLLMMTDGFYRLADPYALYDDATLAQACRQRGLDTMCTELRAYEACGAGSLSVKRADDASAIAWHHGHT